MNCQVAEIYTYVHIFSIKCEKMLCRLGWFQENFYVSIKNTDKENFSVFILRALAIILLVFYAHKDRNVVDKIAG